VDFDRGFKGNCGGDRFHKTDAEPECKRQDVKSAPRITKVVELLSEDEIHGRGRSRERQEVEEGDIIMNLMLGQVKETFGRSIGDLFGHSWRPSPVWKWVWIAKPVGMGGDEHPARPEEIRREGWCARRVVRVPSPSPLHKSFAAAAGAREMSRGAETGGGSKRRFEEERREGGFFTGEFGRKQTEEDRDFRREMQLRDQMMRERGMLHQGDFCPARDSGMGARRWEQ
jgi:hypothetical protein